MKSILVIEDQPEIRQLLALTLQDLSCELHEAADAQAGLELARALLPQLILLDVMMPGPLDGLALCSVLKADPQLRQIKVILLTARGQAEDVKAGHAAGADQYVVKPFSPMALVEAVSRLLALDGPPGGVPR